MLLVVDPTTSSSIAFPFWWLCWQESHQHYTQHHGQLELQQKETQAVMSSFIMGVQQE
jgi:hypothetical protein